MGLPSYPTHKEDKVVETPPVIELPENNIEQNSNIPEQTEEVVETKEEIEEAAKRKEFAGIKNS